MVNLSRRSFLSSMATIAAGGLVGMSIREAMAQPVGKLVENIPRITLGNTGWETPILGFGTIFRSPAPGQKWMTDKQADRLINTLLDSGINIIELAHDYKDSERWFGRVLSNHKREKLFISTKSGKIKKKDVMEELEGQLRRLKVDYLDNYMMHNYFSFIDYDKALEEGGAYEALMQAKEQGKTRFVGMTGHGNRVHQHAARSGKFDIQLMPYNPTLTSYDRALNLASKLNVGTLVMKPFGGNTLFNYNAKDPLQAPVTLTPEECLRFALSNPAVDVVCPNSSNIEQLKENIAIAATFRPLNNWERRDIESKAAHIEGGVCWECKEKPCEKVCPNGIPITFMLSNLQASKTTYHGTYLRGDLYQNLSADFTECDREKCGLCEEVCPKKLDIINYMEEFHNKAREFRGRHTTDLIRAGTRGKIGIEQI